MKVNYLNYKHCKFHRGSKGKNIFKIGPEVKKVGRQLVEGGDVGVTLEVSLYVLMPSSHSPALLQFLFF